jgi:hypothetical protein
MQQLSARKMLRTLGEATRTTCWKTPGSSQLVADDVLSSYRSRVVLPRHASRSRTTPGRWLRPAALLLGLVLLAATFAAGSRYAYCTAMGPIAGAHCPCATKAPRAAHDLTIQSTDCHRIVTVGALPQSTRGATTTSVPVARLAGLFPSQTGRALAFEPATMVVASFTAQQRAGPSASAARARLMVFLL